jgi:hypothetical protein
MERLRAAQVRRTPFAHILVNEIFPADFYTEMRRRMPTDAEYMPLVKTGRVTANYSPSRLCFVGGGDSENKKFWADFVTVYNDTEFLQCWLGLFENDLRERVAARAEGGKAQLGAEMMLMRDKQTYALNPHMDTPSKAISGLFYMPADESLIMQGTSLYKLKHDLDIPGGVHLPRDNFELLGTMPYRPNTLFAFPNVPNTFHGVEPVATGGHNRDVLLYDIKFVGQAAA